MHSEICKPVVVLIAWTLVMLRLDGRDAPARAEGAGHRPRQGARQQAGRRRRRAARDKRSGRRTITIT